MKFLPGLLVFLSVLTGIHGPINAADNVADKPAPEVPKLVVAGTMKQMIGVFSTYGHVAVGDTFEIDLSNLPKQKIAFMRPNFDASKDVSPFVPLLAPLTVEMVQENRSQTAAWIRLVASEHGTGKLVVQVRADALVKGGKAQILFYEESYGKIGAMGEAEGVLK